MAAYASVTISRWVTGVFNATCNALHHEPRRLDQDQGFSEPVTLSLVLYFHFGRHGECVDIVVRKIACEQRMERIVVVLRYALGTTLFFRATPEKVEPSHDNKEPVCYRPSSI